MQYSQIVDMEVFVMNVRWKFLKKQENAIFVEKFKFKFIIILFFRELIKY